MPSKSPKTNNPPAAVSTLPEPETALPELSRRYIRQWISLLFRIVALGILTATLVRQSSWLEQNRILLDSLSGVLALWPFFTGMGKLYLWRIALGRKYAEADRWSDAAQTLAPVGGIQGRLFDVTGEGRYWLALALHGIGKKQEARELLSWVAALPGGEWAKRATEPLPIGNAARSEAS
jgi:hypothetical protein